MNWHEYLTYDAETGALTWKPRSLEVCASERSWKRWNKMFAGKGAGYRHVQKNRQPHSLVVSMHNKLYPAHRIIWMMVHGPIPDRMMIDHINGEPWDNRLANLRLASPAENVRNSRKQVNNVCGLKGVHQRLSGRWHAQIAVNSKVTYLGMFDSAEEAHAAYCEAARIHHGEFARTA